MMQDQRSVGEDESTRDYRVKFLPLVDCLFAKHRVGLIGLFLYH